MHKQHTTINTIIGSVNSSVIAARRGTRATINQSTTHTHIHEHTYSRTRMLTHDHEGKHARMHELTQTHGCARIHRYLCTQIDSQRTHHLSCYRLTCGMPAQSERDYGQRRVAPSTELPSEHLRLSPDERQHIWATFKRVRRQGRAQGMARTEEQKASRAAKCAKKMWTTGRSCGAARRTRKSGPPRS